jgi:pimeloyl-ACP methyl ester carboxylesterase
MHRESVSLGRRRLPGDLAVPGTAVGLVVFAHGSGSSRLSPRNTAVADALNRENLATLLFDLLTVGEADDRANVFDIELLGRRVVEALDWIDTRPDLAALPIGLFGASTGAAAALVAASIRPGRVAAVVSRGGRPDLAGGYLKSVAAPTLLIVGGDDRNVLHLNETALAGIGAEKRLEIVPAATHLFEEPGALEAVARLAAAWFGHHLPLAQAR